MNNFVAAIDCGTNSTRLLIGDGVITAERHMQITRLGEGVDATGILSEEAISRVGKTLREYREIIDSYEVKKVRMTATSAARDASNANDFFDLAEEIIGVRPELLSGIEEGTLSFRGATKDLNLGDGPFLVVDIGGGSTEFILGDQEVQGVISCDIGCVRLTEQWFEHDPPLPEELTSCLSIVEGHLDDVKREIPQAMNAMTFVGLAGTVSCTAAVEQGLHEYEREKIHHFRLTKEAVEDVFRTLATETAAQRLDNPGMEEERSEVIVGGLCVLVKIMRTFGFKECLVSEADILDGLVESIISQGQ